MRVFSFCVAAIPGPADKCLPLSQVPTQKAASRGNDNLWTIRQIFSWKKYTLFAQNIKLLRVACNIYNKRRICCI